MSFLFVDRIIETVPGQYIKGVKHVTYDDSYLAKAPDGNLQFIPSLIGEALGQLAAWNVMAQLDFCKRPVAGIASGAKMLKAVHPGDTIILESFIDKYDDQAVEYHSQAMVDGHIVFELKNALGPMLPMHDFIDGDTVKNQYAQILRTDDSYTPSDGFFTSFAEDVSFQRQAHIDFDAIKNVEAGKSITALKLVNKAASYFSDHFPLKPVLPRTVLLEAKLRLAQYFITQSGLADAISQCEVKRVKMSDFVHPGDELICHLKMKSHNDQEIILTFKSEVNGRRVCVAEISFLGVEPKQ